MSFPFRGKRLRPQRFHVFLGLCCLLLLLPAHAAFAGLTASVTLQSGQPGNIKPTEETVLQITLSNNNAGANISNVAFSKSLPGTLPNGLLVSSAYTYTCYDPVGDTTNPGVGTLTATPGAQGISLSGGVIPRRNDISGVDGYCTILVPITAGSSDGSSTSYTYTLAEGDVTGNDGAAVQNYGAVSQSVNVLAMSRPSISKAFGSSTLVLGAAATTLTITITNNDSTIDLTGVDVTDDFPQLGGDGIIEVASTPNASTTCSGMTFNPSSGDISISATGGSVPAGDSCQIKVDVVAKQTNGAYSTGAQTNTIDRSTDFTNDIGIRANSHATANVTVRSPLRVTKSFSPTSVASGQTGYTTITLYNDSSSALTLSTDFVDSPIDGTGNLDGARGLLVTGASTTCAGGAGATIENDGTNNRGVRLGAGAQIPAGGSCTVRADFTATTQADNTPITYTNSIGTGDVDVGVAGIVSQSASATILVADTLRVLKSRNTSSPRPGNPVQYVTTVQNWSASPLSNVRISDALPSGMTYLTGTINGIDYTPSMSGTGCVGLSEGTTTTGDSTAQLTIGTVPARTGDSSPGSCAVTFYAMTSPSATSGTATTNTISAGEVCENNGGGPICNGGSASSNNSAVNTSTLTLAKSFTPSTNLPEGEIRRMTINLSNYSANPITNLSISDTLPISGSAQMRIATPSNAATTCGGTITAVAGSTSISLNGGTIDGRADKGAGAAGTCTLQVDVLGPAGSYTNTASAEGTQTYADGSTDPVGPASGNASVTYNSILSAIKNFSPDTVASGGRSTVIVRMANSDDTALANVSVTDPLPSGMTVANPANAYTTCAGATNITATPGQSSVSMTGASISGSGSCDLIFDVRAVGASDWTNSIPAGNIIATDSGVFNQSSVADTLHYAPGSALTVSKYTTPSTLTFPGQTSRFTIDILNGSDNVTGLNLTDYFTIDGNSGSALNGMVLTPAPQAATTCPGGIVTATPGGTSVSLTGASLGAGQSCTVSINVTSTSVGGITNYIPSNAIETDQGLTNANPATTSLTTQTNIGVVKQFSPKVIEPGETSRLRLTFYNAGQFAASSLSVSDTLPTGLTIPTTYYPLSTCTGATVSRAAADRLQVSGGQLAAASGGVAGSCYVEVDVTAASEGVYDNLIPSGTLNAVVNGVPVTNTEPAEDILRVKSPLIIHKAIEDLTLDSGNPVGFTTGEATRTPGQPGTLTVRLDNPNSDSLNGVRFTDTLPSGVFIADPTGAATTCNGTVTAQISGTSFRLTNGVIPAGGSCTVFVDVFSNSPGTYDNVIPASAVTTTEGVTNEEPTSARLIVSSPPAISKQFEPSVIAPNGVSKLTIFIENDNDSSMTLSSNLVDTLPTLPGPMLVATPNNLSTTCSGSVTATAGTGSITLPSGSVIPAGGCQIEVDVTAATSGTHNNNIPAGGLQTNLGANQEPANAPLPVSTLGYISGKVFLDNQPHPDGAFQDSAQTYPSTPIEDVTIELRQGNNCVGSLLETVLTDAQGNYLFYNLTADTYSVCEPDQPSGTWNSHTIEGTIDDSAGGYSGTPGTGSNPVSGTPTSMISGIVLAGNGTEVAGSPDNNFSEVLPVSVSGTVFLDEDNNGLFEGVETGLSGVPMTLSCTDWLGNPYSDSANTDANGDYAFTDVPPGTCTVAETTQPTGTSNGVTTAGPAVTGGTAGTASGLLNLPSYIHNIFLPPNTNSVENNFGEIPNGRGVYGLVFLDYGNDGVFDGNDSGLANQTINLTGTDVNGNSVSRTTTTDSNGAFVFTELPESNCVTGYTLTQPSQPTNTLNGITTPGATGGSSTDTATTPSVIANLNLCGSNRISSENLFAEILIPENEGDMSAAKLVALLNDADSNGAVSPGDTLQYSVTLHNSGADALTNATFSDTIPTGLTYVPSSASISGEPANTISVLGQSVSASIPNLPASESRVIRFNVTIAATLPGGGTSHAFCNQGTVDSQETGSMSTDGNDSPADGEQPTCITAVDGETPLPHIDVEKRWELEQDDNGNGLVNACDLVKYTITVVNDGSALAEGLVLTDPITTAMDVSLTANSVTTTQGTILSGQDPSDTEIIVNIGNLPAGQYVRITFVVQVHGDSCGDTDPENPYIIPSQAVVDGNNIGSGGSSGQADSDDNGNDDDGFNPNLTPVVLGSTTAYSPALSHVLTSTSETSSGTTSAVVGEVVTVRTIVDVPPGRLDDAIIRTTLPSGAGCLSYLPNTTRLARVFETGLVAPTNPGGVNSLGSGLFTSCMTDGGAVQVSGQTISIPLGDVVNSDNDANTEQYLMEVDAVVCNSSGNQAGTTLQTNGSLSYSDGDGNPQTLNNGPVQVNVVEPTLSISEHFVIGNLIAHEVRPVAFTINVVNNSAQDAFNAVIVDDLPADFSEPADLTLNGTGVTAVGGFTGTSLNVTATTFPAGANLQISFSAKAAVPGAMGQLTDNSTVTWTSLPGELGDYAGCGSIGATGTSTGERTGDATQAAGSLNDYLNEAEDTNTYVNDPQPVPAINGWGALAMGLLLLAGMAFLRGRRKA